MWKIGNIEIKNKVALAPMAGISNPAYMKICEDMGCGYAITELISSEAIIRDNKKTIDMLKGIENLNMPVAVQLFGSNPTVLKEAAKRITQIYKIKIIDINMGCPVPKVAQRANSGSALLKDPKKVYEIVKAVTSAVNIPVTVKIRSGWDEKSINAVSVAKEIEKASASAITIHPRTRAQGYKGHSDWNIIKEIKQNVSIPVIGNGDIKTKEDAKKMLDETNCDAIMIGRAALGNPWIIKNTIEYLETGKQEQKITPEEKINMIKKHLKNLLETKPEKLAILEIRPHLSHYLKSLPKASDLKNQLYKTKTTEEITNILDKYLKEINKETS